MSDKTGSRSLRTRLSRLISNNDHSYGEVRYTLQAEPFSSKEQKRWKFCEKISFESSIGVTSSHIIQYLVRTGYDRQHRKDTRAVARICAFTDFVLVEDFQEEVS